MDLPVMNLYQCYPPSPGLKNVALNHLSGPCETFRLQLQPGIHKKAQVQGDISWVQNNPFSSVSPAGLCQNLFTFSFYKTAHPGLCSKLWVLLFQIWMSSFCRFYYWEISSFWRRRFLYLF